MTMTYTIDTRTSVDAHDAPCARPSPRATATSRCRRRPVPAADLLLPRGTQAGVHVRATVQPRTDQRRALADATSDPSGRPTAAGGRVHRLAHCDDRAVWDGDQPAMWSIEVEDHEEHHVDKAGGEQCHEHARSCEARNMPRTPSAVRSRGLAARAPVTGCGCRARRCGSCGRRSSRSVPRHRGEGRSPSAPCSRRHPRGPTSGSGCRPTPSTAASEPCRVRNRFGQRDRGVAVRFSRSSDSVRIGSSSVCARR